MPLSNFFGISWYFPKGDYGGLFSYLYQELDITFWRGNTYVTTKISLDLSMKKQEWFTCWWEAIRQSRVAPLLVKCLSCRAVAELHSDNCDLALFYFNYLFLEKGEGREKERERTINVWLPAMCPGMCPNWESNQWPFWFAGWHSIHWAIPARVWYCDL